MFDFLPTYPEKRPKKQKDDKKTTKKQKKKSMIDENKIVFEESKFGILVNCETHTHVKMIIKCPLIIAKFIILKLFPSFIHVVQKKLPYPSFCSWWCFLPNFGAWPTISSGSAGAAARVIYLGSNLKDENIFNIFLWHKWIRLITCFSYILMISLDCWNKMADCLINQPICSNDFNRSYKIIRS